MSSDLMYEIWVQEAEREVHRQILSEGQFDLGRSRTNEIFVSNPNISRQHLHIKVGRDGAMVTDLGSTNGTLLNGRRLVPHQATQWPLQEPLLIGELSLHIRPYLQEISDSSAADGYPMGNPDEMNDQGSTFPLRQHEEFAIVCAEAEPQIISLKAQPVIIGTDPGCTIRLQGANIAAHHCMVQLRDGLVEVTNMDVHLPAALAGVPLQVGHADEWQVNESLQIGDVTLHLTRRQAAGMDVDHAAVGGESKQGLRTFPVLLIAFAGLALCCLSAAGFLAIRRVRCGSLSASCIFAFQASDSGLGENGAVAQGNATPTLAPVVTNQAGPTSIPTVNFEPGVPTPTSVPVDCVANAVSSAGWLDFPFPYEGTDPIFGGGAETFRRISQRSRFGGRINSFFDHEFPVYPPIFGGHEPDNLDNTLVIFNGVRSDDAYSQDDDSADWYSGHAGIDFAPAEPREATTPILAAATGRLLLAKIDDDDNHMVWLEHDPDGDGRFQYATLYFHLHPDEHFLTMSGLEEGAPIQAGQRIGTMGTTGRSSGIHLHFEVRHDANRDGRFSILERIDPYGWFPSQEIVDDPWSALVSWIDNQGDEYEHQGIVSEYLWLHPLVDVVDSAGDCQQVTNVKVDLYNVLGWAIVDPGFTYIARNEQGDVLEVGQPHRRTITILEDDLEGVDPSTMSLEWLNPKLDTWITFEKADPEPNTGGGYTFSAIVDKTGRYVLVAKEVSDRVPPITAVELSGNDISGEANAFRDSVTVTLVGRDRGLIQSDIAEIQYSLDCGQNWKVYEQPFEVTLATQHTCGQADATSETIELSQNDFLLLAMSEDSENNIEQPPSQIRFRIE